MLQWQLCAVHFKQGGAGWWRGEGTTEQGKRSLSEFIKYQGNIAGTGSVSRAGALVPLITTDKKPGAEGGGRGGGGEGRQGSSARDSGTDYREGSKQPGPGVLKVKHTAARAVKFRCLHTDHTHIITDRLRRHVTPGFENMTG